ncbi:FAD-dependent monooxygenase [Actinosynnema sp. NPDC047251]|uniref:FAD-dependent monooxygenase n=1 Tax=Saccharothrix espanaensis TaxID=103731 RepID=UPI000686A661|nr:FAD-dependent monooxygenase [Saccharothrix espanaensis]
MVVVGAGPCGLAMAAKLLQRGIEVRLFDASPEPATGSRAIMLWPPAQDVLADLDVLHEARAIAFRPRALSYLSDGRPLARIRLRPPLDALLLPQERTDELLAGAVTRLGGKVEHGVRVLGVRQHEDGLTVHIADQTGQESRVEASWLIGADGVHSTVRESLGIDFAGSRMPGRFALAEARLRGTVDRPDDVSYHLTASGVLLIAPMPGGTFRIAGDIAPDRELEPGVVDELLERGPAELRVRELKSLTTFSSAERMAGRMRLGRCFLVGDAAHTHSPFGGQGLNLGLHDVRNLAWKLAGVLDGTFGDALLDTYDVERRAAARFATRLTGTLMRAALSRSRWKRPRGALVRCAHHLGILQRWYAPVVAGRRTRHPSVHPGPTNRFAGLPAPPWALEGNTVPDRFRLVTTGPAERSALSTRAAALADRRATLVDHHHLRRLTRGFLLVRPDGYVAIAGGPHVLDGVDRYLTDLEDTGGNHQT